MSSQMYRRQLEHKRRQRVDAERKAAEYSTKEAAKRSDAAKARLAASKTTSASTVASKLRESERRENEANSAGKEVATWRTKAATYSKEEAALQEKLTKAELSERATEDSRRERARKAEIRLREQAQADTADLRRRVEVAESGVQMALRELRPPKQEKLRILMLAASAEGDLRVGREQKRIRAAVESARHRDLVEFDMRPSATTGDLLDGVTRFRPHVVHFTGHSGENLIEFEDDLDEHHESVIVTARAFARALAATDDPPLLILLNSCNSASQIDHLVAGVTPFAIGMSESIEDVDAIVYATQFYAALTNGQSIESSHLSGQAAVELAGLPGHDFPVLAHAPDVDPRTTILVRPPD